MSERFKYREADANAVIFFLQESGFKDVQVIGGIKKVGHSNNDIDILLPNNSLDDRNRLEELLMSSGVTETDWGGLFFDNTQFGDIDIFFSTKDFDY